MKWRFGGVGEKERSSLRSIGARYMHASRRSRCWRLACLVRRGERQRFFRVRADAARARRVRSATRGYCPAPLAFCRSTELFQSGGPRFGDGGGTQVGSPFFAR